jgi:hypothetical protein
MSEASERIWATLAFKEDNKCMSNFILFYRYDTGRLSVFVSVGSAMCPLQVRGGRTV